MEKLNNLKMTAQRRVILEELQKTRTHPTADELYVRVRERLPDISLATIYRNLDILSEHGLIRKLWEGAGPKRYNGDLRDHYHVVCERCGRVGDLVLDPANGFLERARDASGYAVEGCRVEFYGLCPACRGVPAGPGEGAS